ncbi:MAG TPA: hypothetical protein VJT32_04555 [bacterium]|nr:hypothetical protein [bacterium]
MKVILLCPACSACPTVEIGDREVRIGAGDNLVRLSPAEWNVLVEAIRTRELDKIKSND